ncbi:Bug family tripartite tricarboxylate transporter substrate binding protein [Polaromonas sp.]|uniref:Bug family tripartite tricarboxylate transporter substrate binding protein n=1 Tax=Polaromonas sp. TaxID=1869339 RepID=UPI003BADA366
MKPTITPTHRRRGLMRHLGLASLAFGAALCAGSALAQAASPRWQPTKPIRMVVNLPPGTAMDSIARVLAVPVQEALGQQIVVDNRAGAGGLIGGDLVAKSPPDGYTLLATPGSLMAIVPFVYEKTAFDPNKDLMPIAGTARALLFLVAKPSLPANNIQEFIRHLKANPGKYSYGSAGNGSSPHLAGEMFKRDAGVNTTHVPYKGTAPALQDLLAGQLDYTFDAGASIDHVRSGRLKLLAIANTSKSSIFPDVPTLQEAGLKDFDASTVYGIYAPAGTPANVVARLNEEINKALQLKPVRDRIAALGAEVVTGTPVDLARSNQDDGKRFGAIARALHIRPD